MKGNRYMAIVMSFMLSFTLLLTGLPKTVCLAETGAEGAEKKTPGGDEYMAYLFVSFTGTEGSPLDEQIYFAVSEDGYNYMDLNNGKPVLESDIGEKGVRDPYIIRSVEGDKFYLLATDLSIYYRGGWGRANATVTGSHNLIIWESEDLVNWSEPRAVCVASPDAGCAWAPEAIYNEKTGEYVIYFAESLLNNGRVAGNMCIYAVTTKDFVNFSDAECYIESPGRDIIDTTMIKADDGYYYRASKDGANDDATGSIRLDRSDDIFGEWETVTSLGNLGFDRDMTNRTLEGPELFKYNEKDWVDGKLTYGLYTDRYIEGTGYLPLITTDLSDADNSYDSWKLVPETNYTFDTLKKRHGTILSITRDEYERILKAYPNDEAESLIEDDMQGPILSYDFEDTGMSGIVKDASPNGRDGKLFGNAAVIYDEEKESNVLSLDGSKDTYAELPEGFFNGRNTFTVSMDVKAESVSGNYATFVLGQNDSGYLSFKVSDESVLAITKNGANYEQRITAEGSDLNKWVNYTVVLNESDTGLCTLKLFKDGVKAGEKKTYVKPTRMGNNLVSYIGKAFYPNYEGFTGRIDNVTIYNQALTDEEIKAAQTGAIINYDILVKSDDLNIIKTHSDRSSKKITVYVSKNNSKIQNPDNAKFLLDITGGAKIVSGQEEYHYSTKPFTVEVSNGALITEWTIEMVQCNNPILPGEFADPDIDMFDGKYYIYPTTDGISGWGGYQFHVFSSDNLVDWKDEGVILDLKADESYKNENGIDTGIVKWADGNAWAPSIEEKDGKYYFYFCGHDKDTDAQAIGVAVADSPIGPFTAADTPVITMEDCKNEGISMGQTIDPSIYTEEDGTSYMLFGNGSPAIAELAPDMMSFIPGTVKNYTGATGFREAITVTKNNGQYHFTWSQDDTGSENYQVNYGVSDSLYGPIDYKYPILQKDVLNNILGTGHHSILYVPERNKYYIAYHRFMTPLGQIDEGFGYHREVCLDELEFGEDGLIKKVVPTLTGVGLWTPPPSEDNIVNVPVSDSVSDSPKTGTDAVMAESVKLNVKPSIKIGKKEKVRLKASVYPENASQTVTWKSSKTSVVSVSQSGRITAKRIGKAVITATAENGKNISVKVTVRKAPKKISVKPKVKRLKKGRKFNLKVKLPKKTASYKLTYKSNKKAVAAVSKKGKVTAKRKGTAIITVQTFNKKKGKVKVIVR